MSFDGIKWEPHARVEKYSPEVVRELTEFLGYEPDSADFARLSITPQAVTEVSGNLLTTAGLSRITSLIIGGGGTAFSSANSAIGVGNSSTAATVADVALGANATANARYNATDATYPSASNGVITAVATFDTGEANFAWNEWCWVAAAATITEGTTIASLSSTGTAEVMLNRKVASMGTKAAGATWVFTTTVTLS